MKNWTIGKRIITGGAVLLAFLLIVSGVAITSLSNLEKFAGNQLRDDAVPGIVSSSEIAQHTMQGHISALMAGAAADTITRDRYIADVQKNVDVVLEGMKRYESSISDEEDRKSFAELKQVRATYAMHREEYLTLVKAGKKTEAEALIATKLEPAFVAYGNLTSKMLEWDQQVAGKVTNDMIATAHRSTLMAWIVSGVSLVAAVILGWVIIGGTNQVLTGVSLALNEGAEQVNSASTQVSASSQSLAEGASEQAASLEETSSSLEEMASMTRRNADNALKANELAKDARHSADKGVQDMQTMAAAMEAIKVSSDDIAKIIKTIDEIAFQTNILALNAAVEAARAGEAGMGFAVVADEVRSLAQRCAQAAKETSDKIQGAIVKTGQGVEMSGQVAQALNDIAIKVRQVDELIAEVAGASREQTQGIAQINVAVTQMDKVTQSNAANSEETAAAAEELNAQAESMKQSVAELLALVGGAGAVNKQPHAVVSPARANKPAGLPKANGYQSKQASLMRELGSSTSHNGQVNGHRNGNGSELPMEAAFKDF
jgi:methyl-accepting chemotaxis protein